MNIKFVEVPIDIVSSPYAMPADLSEGPLPDDQRIGTRPVAVTETRFRPGGRVEVRPTGFIQPRPATYAVPSRGAALAVAAQFIITRGSQALVNDDIDARLLRLRASAHAIMRQHRHGGILAVANIIVRFDPSFAWGAGRPGEPPAQYSGPEARRLETLYLADGVYSLPEHAISVWRHASNLEAGPAASGEYLEHRFFWGTWRWDAIE